MSPTGLHLVHGKRKDVLNGENACPHWMHWWEDGNRFFAGLYGGYVHAEVRDGFIVSATLRDADDTIVMRWHREGK